MAQSVQEVPLERPLLIGDFHSNFSLEVIHEISLVEAHSALHIDTLSFSFVLPHPPFVRIAVLENYDRPSRALLLCELSHVQLMCAYPHDSELLLDFLHLCNEACVQGAVAESCKRYMSKK